MSNPRGNDDSSQRWRILFEDSLAEIDRAVSWASRRLCLHGDDAEEFRSWVYEKLIDDDYRVLREFTGRSRIATYLVAVIMNLGRDYRMKTWSRWRPSAQAERLGLVAIQLETLLERDGFSMDEATESLRANHGVKLSPAEIADLAAKLPPRTPLTFERGAAVESAAVDSRTDERVEDSERAAVIERAEEALADALSELGIEDRLVLEMHYQSGLTVAAIASALDLDQRSLYTRRDRCLRALKAGLERRGLQPAEVLPALGWSDRNFQVNYGLKTAEFGPNVPSNRPRAEIEDSP